VAGFAASVLLLFFTERVASRRALASLGTAAALVFAFIYFFGVMASADSGVRRVLPRFP
jgi:hypothetical protein